MRCCGRCSRPPTGEPYQRVLEPAELDWELPVTRVAERGPGRGGGADRRRSRSTWPREIPLRARLLAAGAGEHVLVLVIHHIATDGWSAGPLARDLSRGVRGPAGRARRRAGRRCRCSTPTTRSGSGSCWHCGRPGQRAGRAAGLLAGRAGRGAAGAGAAGGPAASGRCQPPGARGPLEVPAGLHARLAGLAREQGATLFMVLQAALAVLLSRLGAGDRHPGRHRRWPGGPMRRSMTWSGSSSTRWCCAPTCPATRRSASCWAGCASPAWARWITRTCRSSGWWRRWRPDRSLARHPLFQVMLTLQNNAPAVATCPGCGRRAARPGPAAAKFDLDVSLAETPRRGRRPGRAARRR